MRFTALIVFSVLLMAIISLPADAKAKRSPRGYKSFEKEKTKTEKKEKTDSEEIEKEKATSEDLENLPLQPSDMLLEMLSYESSVGILDCMVNVVEVTENLISKTKRSIRKEIYFLAPSRTLTIKDSIPIYYVDEDSFKQIMSRVDLELMIDETIAGVDCYVIKMAPIEKGFSRNVKHYYLAKDDFRKIRIDAVRFNSKDEKRFNVTDFIYHYVEGTFYLPLKSESRMYDERDFLLQKTTATFLHWKFNTGLTPEFFDKKLNGFELYNIVK